MKKPEIPKDVITNLIIDLNTTGSVNEFLDSRSLENCVQTKIVNEQQEDKMEKTPQPITCATNQSSAIENASASKDSVDIYRQGQSRTEEYAPVPKGAFMTIRYENQDPREKINHPEDVIVSAKDISNYEVMLENSNTNTKIQSDDLDFIKDFNRNFKGVESIVVKHDVSDIDSPEIKDIDTINGMFPVNDYKNSFVIGGSDYHTLRRIMNFSKYNKR